MKINFHSKTPEIFDSLDEAQIAMNNNPLPYPKMRYSISKDIVLWDKDDKGYNILEDKYQVSSFGANGAWMGFLNTKRENV